MRETDMRALITGISGFAGQHLKRNLLENGYQVWGSSRKPSDTETGESDYKQVQLNLSENLHDIVALLDRIQPNVIFHLSGQSSVKRSWDHVAETLQSNVMESIQLLEAVKQSSVRDRCVVLTVGSSEEYGKVAELPITEDTATHPTNPYGVSKLALGHLAKQYAVSHQLKVIHVRAFNHIGPGQSLGFVTSDFAKQIAEIDLEMRDPVISVGDLSSSRDFTDVRDIVNGYRLLAERGRSGEIYNICSGKSVAIRELLDMFLTLTDKAVKVDVDQSKFRPNEVKEYYGSNEKITNDTGWQPTIPLQQSLRDIFLEWRSKLSKAKGECSY
jgi:GDP-4-dehydro-6-deoxy-D-mannose reductase